MTQLVKNAGGEIRSFDGDRVMGVFLGNSKHSSAASCALKMNHVVTKILRPKAEARFPSLVRNGFRLTHCAGIHTSQVLVVRGGVHGDNDLVFIGSAPNLAAKLSEIRNSPYHSYITHAAFRSLDRHAKTSSQGKQMWEKVTIKLGDETWETAIGRAGADVREPSRASPPPQRWPDRKCGAGVAPFGVHYDDCRNVKG